MPTFSLEIGIHKWYGDNFAVELRLRRPDDAGDDAPVRGLTKFDFVELLSHSDDAKVYGEKLTEMLFSDREVRDKFILYRTQALAQAPNLAQAPKLRVRLFVAPSAAAELNGLRWETLRDPLTNTWMLTSAQLIFARFQSGINWEPVHLRPRRDLSTLSAVANPTGLSEAMRLSPEQVKGLSEALSGLRHRTLLATEKEKVSKQTLSRLLLNRFDILYLVCHGALVEGRSILALEKENGPENQQEDNAQKDIDYVDGEELVQMLSDLREKPTLVVLASCQSAGTGMPGETQKASADRDRLCYCGLPLTGRPQEAQRTSAELTASAADQGAGTDRLGEALSALGPRLAEIGIPAVLAMQGKVTVETVRQFMPVFFSHLQNDVPVDEAVALARRAVAGEDDSWMPVLYMRLISGKLWKESGIYGDQPFQKWEALLNDIQQGYCTPILGSGLLEPYVGSTRQLAKNWAKTHGFPLAAQAREDLPQVARYVEVIQHTRFLRDALVIELNKEIAHRYYLPDLPRSQPEKLKRSLSRIGAQRRKDPKDAYRVLASLPFPVYLTTNPDDLLADALKETSADQTEDQRKDPQVEMCRWKRSLVDDSKREKAWPESVYNKNPDYEPSVNKPLVYHLFGRLEELDSLVLTEDNYFDYLIGVTRKEDPIPPVVRDRMASTALLFLGFQIDDWDFRVFFRSLRGQEGSKLLDNYTHVAVQIDPDESRITDAQRARDYLRNYFGVAHITIFWGSVDDFIRELHKKWTDKQEAESEGSLKG